MEILVKDEVAPDALPEEDRPETPVEPAVSMEEAEPPPADASLGTEHPSERSSTHEPPRAEMG